MAFRRLTLESFAVIFLIAETSVRCANAATGEIRGEISTDEQSAAMAA